MERTSILAAPIADPPSGRNDYHRAESVHCLRSCVVAFQRKEPEAIGTKALFPGFIAPALASPIEKVPSGTRWDHEIKFDGYRVQVHLANEEVKIYTRRSHDWTHRFKKVANDAWYVSASSANIDGEIVVPSVDGTADFSGLQNELRGKSTRIVLVAFDLLYLNGRDLRKLPLTERKAVLKNSSTALQSNSAKASRSTAPRCSLMHASSAMR
jgi:bifunctional non-homologous end joining protein LigD